jgi:hypothetical protein
MGMTFSLRLSCAALVRGEGQRGGDPPRPHHRPRAQNMGGPMGRGLLQTFVQQTGNRHHRRATPPTGGYPPQEGEGVTDRSGITYREFKFSRRSAEGVRGMGRG